MHRHVLIVFLDLVADRDPLLLTRRAPGVDSKAVADLRRAGEADDVVVRGKKRRDLDEESEQNQAGAFHVPSRLPIIDRKDTTPSFDCYSLGRLEVESWRGRSPPKRLARRRTLPGRRQ